MKIAYLSRGNNIYDRRFLEKMVERRHEPHFISYYPCQPIEVEGVRNYFYDYKTMHRFGRFLSIQTALHLRRLLNRIQPDILHSGWIPDMGFFGALSGFHPTLSMPWGSDILIKPYLSRSLMLRTQFTLRRANMITCDCELVKKKIIELSGCSHNKIVIFPWGTDLKIFWPNDSGMKIRQLLGWQGNKVLIMTRSMDKPLYGHATFIKCLPTVIRTKPETRVIFVGSGSFEAKFRMTINELGLKEYVYFTSWVDDVTMAKYLNAADVYISTATSDGSSASLMEAMTCGLPVVVTDAPANLEWVVEDFNGYIVPKNDSKMLAKRLIKLLNDESVRQEMGQRNLEIARERADWEKNFDILEGIYRDLVNN